MINAILQQLVIAAFSFGLAYVTVVGAQYVVLFFRTEWTDDEVFLAKLSLVFVSVAVILKIMEFS